MTAFTFLLALAGAAAFYVVFRRIPFLEDAVRRVESLLSRFEQGGAVSPRVAPREAPEPVRVRAGRAGLFAVDA